MFLIRVEERDLKRPALYLPRPSFSLFHSDMVCPALIKQRNKQQMPTILAFSPKGMPSYFPKMFCMLFLSLYTVEYISGIGLTMSVIT